MLVKYNTKTREGIAIGIAKVNKIYIDHYGVADGEPKRYECTIKGDNLTLKVIPNYDDLIKQIFSEIERQLEADVRVLNVETIVNSILKEAQYNKVYLKVDSIVSIKYIQQILDKYKDLISEYGETGIYCYNQEFRQTTQICRVNRYNSEIENELICLLGKDNYRLSQY